MKQLKYYSMKIAVMDGLDEYVELLLKHPKGLPLVQF
jgi:hypothetical protein